MISKLYQAMQLSKRENTEYIKKKRGKEVKIMITQESWEKICQLHWLSTGSDTWWEICWKNLARFFSSESSEKILEGEYGKQPNFPNSLIF